MVQLSQLYMTTGETIALIIIYFCCLCFSTHCLGLSLLSCQEAIIFWLHSCSHCPQWFYSPRRGNLSLSKFSSVARSCPTLCDPMDCSMPGLPVHHNSWSPPKLMCMESVMPSSHLILCHPLLLPPIFPSMRVFSNESTLRMRWAKYWSFSISISPSNEHPGLVSFRMDWLDLQSKGLSRVFSKTTVQKHQFFGAQLSSQK